MATALPIKELKIDKNLDILKERQLSTSDLIRIRELRELEKCPPILDIPRPKLPAEERRFYRNPELELFKLIKKYPVEFRPWRQIILECRADRAALMAIFRKAVGYNWHNNKNWGNPCAPLSSWSGVTTKTVLTCIVGRFVIYLQRIVELDLSYNNLGPRKLDPDSGRLAPEIGQLTCLKKLYLNNNFLRGRLPDTLGKLTALTDLRLQYNQFTGDIPSSLGNLVNLTRLQLDHNRLSGHIPSTLGNLVKIEGLFLHCNNLRNRNLYIFRPRPGTPSFSRLVDQTERISSTLGMDIRERDILDYYGGIEKQSSITAKAEVSSALADIRAVLIRPRVSINIPASFANLSKMQEFTVYENHLTGNITEALKKLPCYQSSKANNHLNPQQQDYGMTNL